MTSRRLVPTALAASVLVSGVVDPAAAASPLDDTPIVTAPPTFQEEEPVQRVGAPGEGSTLR